MEGLIKVLPGKVVVYTCYVTRGLSFETGGGWKKIVKIIDGTGKKKQMCIYSPLALYSCCNTCQNVYF